jgi:hypothetical protein
MMKILIEDKNEYYVLTATVKGIHCRYIIDKEYNVDYDSEPAPLTRSEVQQLILLYEATS